MEPSDFSTLLAAISAVAIGIGLSAAAGFRVFVPLLMLALAARFAPELVPLGPGFAWLTSWPAIVLLASATLAEVAAYYVPWVDNALDSLATPAALISGTLLSAAVLPEMPESLRWGLAAILGGGSAGLVQTGSVLLRAASSATTGGLGNPVVSTAEAVGAVATSLLALLVPLFTVVLLFLLLCWFLYRRMKRKTPPPSDPRLTP